MPKFYHSDSDKEGTRRAPGRPKAEDRGTPVRDLVLQAASVLFMEQGYEAVSLNQIAERCGVTKASVYYHFTSKPVLFTASVTDMLRKAKAGTERLLESGGTLRERLLRIAQVRLARSQHAEFETLMREASHWLTAEQKNEIREAEDHLHQLLAVHFRKALDAGEVKKGNPLLMAHLYTALLMIGNREAAQGMYGSIDELADQMMDLFWSGIDSVRPLDQA
ncbi:transcriptional regulator, TetR family [Paenibacillus sp. RU4T]|uniref:TetR/AcrR family transcriptional regulator n=1 Tax=unclassified Paenibacillus TaxID=185978 RepID=UPI00095602B1|nr:MULTISPECIES: TetR/AcrR family transcriptional regulator [unclassified Paenibacillus]SIQ80384.1 transcriptional regulator, TetR family [Paenibacillus sp. RU4X]SIR01747.1 transcriptional regulator, TetR family [Paenibacillus sp. RU4T]